MCENCKFKHGQEPVGKEQSFDEQLDEILQRLWYAGWTAHKASLVSGNSKIAALEEQAREDSEAAIKRFIAEGIGSNDTEFASISHAKTQRDQNELRSQLRQYFNIGEKT